jgi:FixJ family two-component response regulator
MGWKGWGLRPKVDRDISRKAAGVPTPAIVAVIDDDAEIRDAMGCLLRSRGVEMHGFETAEAFLEHADEVEIGCLITDLHMPGIGGIELLRRLRQRGVAYPIIVMSARERAQAAAQAHGADAYISKPIDGDDLMGWLVRLGLGA